MNYINAYANLICNAKKREFLNGYFERHHILPKAMGGSNNKENIVCLTAREHFIAHIFLAKIYGGSMWFAVIRMKGKKNRYVNSKLYEIAKKYHAIETSKINKIRMIGNNNGIGNKSRLGQKLSIETRAKMSKALIGNKHSFGKKLSEETKEKMRKPKPLVSLALKGVLHTEERKAKVSASIKKWWEIRKIQQSEAINHGY